MTDLSKNFQHFDDRLAFDIETTELARHLESLLFLQQQGSKTHYTMDYDVTKHISHICTVIQQRAAITYTDKDEAESD